MGTNMHAEKAVLFIKQDHVESKNNNGLEFGSGS